MAEASMSRISCNMSTMYILVAASDRRDVILGAATGGAGRLGFASGEMTASTSGAAGAGAASPKVLRRPCAKPDSCKYPLAMSRWISCSTAAPISAMNVDTDRSPLLRTTICRSRADNAGSRVCKASFPFSVFTNDICIPRKSLKDEIFRALHETRMTLA